MKKKDAYTDLISPYVKLEPINIDTQESTDIDTLKQNCIDTLKQSGIQDDIEVDALNISSDNPYTYTIHASGDNGTYTYTYTPITTTQEYQYNDINTLGLWAIPPEDDYLTELEARLKSGEDSIYIYNGSYF